MINEREWVEDMSSIATDYKHIVLNEQNVPTIAGTTMKVVELITSVKAYNWTPEQLLENYPHLSLSKIHSALAYYWDHQAAIDADIERRHAYVTQLRLAAGASPVSQRLRAEGRIP
jgi:uncharacterized protein (DUF433 family)